MSCRSHSSLSRLGLSQGRLVPSSQTGSEKAPTGDQQVPKWLEGTCGVIGSHIETHIYSDRHTLLKRNCSVADCDFSVAERVECEAGLVQKDCVRDKAFTHTGIIIVWNLTDLQILSPLSRLQREVNGQS